MNYGDWVSLQDRRGRRYMFRLKPGGQFNYHRGSVSHQAVLAAGFGNRVTTPQGEPFTVHRPTLEDYLLDMAREATPT